MSKSTIIVNRGQRTYHLVQGPAGEARTIPPGASIEVLDEKEAKHLLRYHDLKPIDEVAPQTAARIKGLEAEIDRLKAEETRLKKEHSGVGEPGSAAASPVLSVPVPPSAETVEPRHAAHHKKGR